MALILIEQGENFGFSILILDTVFPFNLGPSRHFVVGT
jgi:hypothetical protein